MLFPTISLGEINCYPTSLVYRNLMSMDVEEMIGAQPMDGCILIGGCDKTVPAQLMGATSANILTAQLVTGPMSTDNFKGERLGACTDCRSNWMKYRSGLINKNEITEIEKHLATTHGTCALWVPQVPWRVFRKYWDLCCRGLPQFLQLILID